MLNKLTSMITSTAGRQILVLQKNSPKLLMATGVAGFVGTIVLATRATMKLEDVLEEGQKDLIDVKYEEGAIDSEEETKKKTLLVRLDIAVKVAKLYLPAAGLGLVTLGAFTGSHVILNRRYIGTTAALAATDRAYKEYRQRIAEEFGSDKEREIHLDLVDKEIAVETDEGPVVKTVKARNGKGLSMYAKCFDEQSSNWSPERSYNQMFLRSQQNYANDLLRSRHHVFLNEVYDMLGLERTDFGQVVGWVYGNGDSYIDFGVFDREWEGQQFVNGDEKSVWLDFNVDGVVYDLI